MVMLLFWMSPALPPAPCPWQVVDLFAGKGRIARMARLSGQPACAMDIEYHQNPRIFDINSEPGFAFLSFHPVQPFIHGTLCVSFMKWLAAWFSDILSWGDVWYLWSNACSQKRDPEPRLMSALQNVYLYDFIYIAGVFDHGSWNPQKRWETIPCKVGDEEHFGGWVWGGFGHLGSALFDVDYHFEWIYQAKLSNADGMYWLSMCNTSQSHGCPAPFLKLRVSNMGEFYQGGNPEAWITQNILSVGNVIFWYSSTSSSSTKSHGTWGICYWSIPKGTQESFYLVGKPDNGMCASKPDGWEFPWGLESLSIKLDNGMLPIGTATKIHSAFGVWLTEVCSAPCCCHSDASGMGSRAAFLQHHNATWEDGLVAIPIGRSGN